MPRHAIEIVLKRPAHEAELARAQRRLPLAVNADGTHLMTLVRAGTQAGALARVRRRVGNHLPVDVLTTHYPDTDGKVELSVDLPEAVDAHIRELAAACRLTPGVYFAQAVTIAAARDAEVRVRRLQSTLEPLLAHTSPQEVLVAVARALTRDQPGLSTAAGDVHEST